MARESVAGPYARVEVRLHDRLTEREYLGMAEARGAGLARVRAAAEAYEKCCFEAFLSLGGFRLDRARPYGLAAAGSAAKARRLAFGEYWERRRVAELGARAEDVDGEPRFAAHDSGRGVVHTCLVGEAGRLGSGYGLSARDALDSARRSLLRKVDFALAPHVFTPPTSGEMPREARLTPDRGAWLEVHLWGHGLSEHAQR